MSDLGKSEFISYGNSELLIKDAEKAKWLNEFFALTFTKKKIFFNPQIRQLMQLI